MKETIIVLENVTKKYDKDIIFSNVSLNINKGESIAIVGKNGKGKSTFLRVISGLTKIEEGNITYSRKLKFNFVPENFTRLNITAREYISLIADIEGINKKDLKEKLKYLVKEFFLEDMMDTPIKFLSKGTIQKVSVLQALFIKPDVLLLDEPLSGQDIASQRNFIKIVKSLIKNDVTVLMACHEALLIKELSNRVLEIDNKSINEVSKDDLKDINVSTMVFVNDIGLKSFLDENSEKVITFNEEDDEITIKVSSDISNEFLKEIINHGYILRYYEE
ncbi:ATP-binding cassette domain-containing protein [uncultured Clostridium sp.]|uniref:ATP-binding cassette domain-containing protein n=1 Tax=uncultured Clostridium sp. TaxID=59620 RepID=UPI0025DEEA35|nr:ABC transporter ATP-binding protein [uncultured Clostridium sp.]